MSAIHINQNTFHRMIHQESPVLVDYWAPWCSYCRRINPAYDKIAEQYADTLTVAKVNIDEEVRLADAEGIEIIPTLVLYHKGKPLGSITAPESKAAIEQFIRDTLAQ